MKTMFQEDLGEKNISLGSLCTLSLKTHSYAIFREIIILFYLSMYLSLIRSYLKTVHLCLIKLITELDLRLHRRAKRMTFYL